MAKLDSRRLKSLPATSNKHGQQHHDDALKGYFLVKYPSGKITFYVRYTIDGRRQVVRVGSYGTLTCDEARREARRILANAELGKDESAVREQRKMVPTMREWAEVYLESIGARKKSAREDRRYLALAISTWGNTPIDKLRASDIRRAVEEIGQSHRTSANRFLASVRACLGAAEREELLSQNPARNVKAFPENAPRRRTLDKRELARLLSAIREEPDYGLRLAFLVLVTTGARSSEVRTMRWGDLKLDELTWTIPNTKSGCAQCLPIPAELAAEFQKAPRTGPYVCAGKLPDKPRADLSKPWKRLLERAGLGESGLWLHDLRRTAGLELARANGILAASRVLRHSDIRITQKVYVPLAADDIRDAIQDRAKSLWGNSNDADSAFADTVLDR